jgi:AcrR family transcriptional regulator
MTRAYRRLENDERRQQLLALGQQLFTEHAFDELSMARIAKEAGISKALLYHYFPGKRDYFLATLASGAQELRAAIEPDPDAPPLEALTGALETYLAWIDENADSYRRLLQSAAAIPEVRDLIEGVRAETAQRILDGLDADSPRARAATRGWLWFVDGVCLDWLAHRDLTRDEVRDLVLATLMVSLGAAGALP